MNAPLATPPDKAYLASLIRLLDDPSEKIAQSAMTELLRHSTSLDPILAELQESDDALLRRRIHQLQAILTLRNRRKKFAKLLAKKDFDMLDALIELHLQWFDNDSKPAVEELVGSFLDSAEMRNLDTLAKLGAFMRESGFDVPAENEQLDPENFCVGTVLEDRLGSDLLLAILTILLGNEIHLELALVRLAGRFAVVDRRGNLLIPADSWNLTTGFDFKACEFWNNPAQILRYAALMLFLYATGSDSFRYIHTIGHALAGDDGVDFLPYPYGGEPKGGDGCPLKP